MRFVLRIIGTIIANLLGIWIIIQLLLPFRFSGDSSDLFFLAAVLTLLNWIVKPVLKVVLSPIIFLTLGLGVIAVNMIVLYILDILSQRLTIEGNVVFALFLASIIVGAVNIVAHAVTHSSQST